mgnify:CR=1 FL=1
MVSRRGVRSPWEDEERSIIIEESWVDGVREWKLANRRRRRRGDDDDDDDDDDDGSSDDGSSDDGSGNDPLLSPKGRGADRTRNPTRSERADNGARIIWEEKVPMLDGGERRMRVYVCTHMYARTDGRTHGRKGERRREEKGEERRRWEREAAGEWGGGG